MLTTPTPLLSPKFQSAVGLAFWLYNDRLLDNSVFPTVPYTALSFAVVGYILEDGGSESEAIASLMYDVPDDPTSIEEEFSIVSVETIFGAPTANLIRSCREIAEVELDEDGKTKTPPRWQKRKQKFLQALRDGASPEVLRLFSANMLYTIRTLYLRFGIEGDSIWNGWEAVKEEYVWYIVNLDRVVSVRSQGPLRVQLHNEVSRFCSALGISDSSVAELDVQLLD